MLQNILSDFSNEIFDILIVEKPSIETVKIVLHALAARYNSWEHCSECSNIFGYLGRFSSLLIEIKLLYKWDGSVSIRGALSKLI